MAGMWGALVALALLVVVPPGFMVAGDGPARITICTGHGAVESSLDLSGKGAPAKRGKADSPCAFAGHAAPLAQAPAAPAVTAAWTFARASNALPASQIAPGRGLAAPPPATGPPVTSQA
jgi:hypothetical protein